MEYVSTAIHESLSNASGIRKMFEAGLEMKKKYGADNVYDFSLGNPDVPPPPAVAEALRGIAARADQPFSLGYMPNAGYPELREKLGAYLTEEQGVAIPGNRVLVTVGAASALNVFFRAVLEPGDEVMTPCPYFVEYGSYCGNYGGILKTVPSQDFTFELDVPAMAAALTPKTRAIILNSPHNPTGAIYSRASLEALAAAVTAAEARYGRPIYVIADEPHRFLNFDQAEIPCFFTIFSHSAIVGSFSKSLSLAGERVGYLAVDPKIAGGEELMNALILCNRILGYVNAPAIGQQILMACLHEQVDREIYRRRRQAMAEALDGAKIAYTMPRGAFYFFPQSPVPDERVFVDALLKERILAVPGRSFGTPGYVRLAFCVDEKVIRAAAPGFARAAARLR